MYFRNQVSKSMDSMVWILIKALFNKTSFKKTLKKLNKEKVIEYKQRAIVEENYELAAYLKYYIEMKYEKVY
jgi:hypothetical protein